MKAASALLGERGQAWSFGAQVEGCTRLTADLAEPRSEPALLRMAMGEVAAGGRADDGMVCGCRIRVGVKGRAVKSSRRAATCAPGH